MLQTEHTVDILLALHTEHTVEILLAFHTEHTVVILLAFHTEHTVEIGPGGFRAPCVLACAMRSLAIVITIVQSLSPLFSQDPNFLEL